LIRGGQDTGEEDTLPQIVNTEGAPLFMQLVPDDISQAPLASARLRVMHAINGAIEIGLRTPALPVDPDAEPVEEEEPDPDAPPPPPVTLVQPVVFGAEANQGEVPTGIYEELNFLAGGTTRIAQLEQQQIVDGLVYTYVLIGQPGGEPPLEVLTLRDYGTGLPQERLFRGTIVSNQPVVNVRAQAALTSGTIARVNNGDEVEVLGRNFNGEWINVRFSDSATGRVVDGWVFAPLINVTRLGVPINVLSLPVSN
jgi:hypothetical protein